MKRFADSVCGTDGGLRAAARSKVPGAGVREHVRALLLTSSAVAMTVPPISSALAQEIAAQDVRAPESEKVEQVLVTASRAAVNGFSAPSPTAVVGSDVIDRQAATTIAMVLNQNPAFKPTRNPGANATNTSSPGQATADLRALGGQRTLVLVNGMRVVPQAPASTLGVPVTTDLNLIPTPMIDRVEVVTGGASAQYGSDAVAGVVNIILKNKFDGVEFKTQYGVAEEGDFRSKRFGGLAGAGFADERGHVVFSVDYDDNDGVGDIYSRDWGRKEYQIVTNAQRATNGLPALLLTPGVHNNLGAGGLITGPANFSLRNYTFNADGSIRPFDSGSLPNGVVQIGGEGQSIATGVSTVPAVRRLTSYGRVEYELSEALTAFVEAGYSESKAVLHGLPLRISGASIARDNAFLPTQVRDAMVAANLNNITFSRIGYDTGNLRTEVINETPHAAFGLKGTLGGSWSWDAHYSVGRNNYRGNSYNNQIGARTRWAMDAVVDPVSGRTVCRATLPGASFQADAAGCVPINLFGEGAASRAALDYMIGNGQTRVAYTQHAAAANLRGEPFSTWAGPVSAAAGIEYRREKQVVTADPIAAANGFSSSGNAAVFSGDFDVKEAYVETILPLARDLRFANSVDLDLAVRQAEYSTVGGQTTWKAGATYEPFTGLRLRSTRSKDIRAPALFELLSPGSSVTNTLNVLGRSGIIPQNTSLGNPNLKAEEADTFTVGMVIEPEGALSDLQFSIDYYRIKLNGAISNLSALNIANLCTLGNQSYCDMFTFSPTGQPLSLTAPARNVAAFENSGIDFVASYNKNLADWGGHGTLLTSFSGTWIDHAWVDLGIGSRVDRAGENGQANLGAIPRFRANLSQTYMVGPASLTAQFVYVSSGRQDNTYNTAPSVTIDDNSVPAVTYVNLFGSWDISSSLQIFATVSNVMDKDPPPVPYAVLNVPTNGIYYDKVGRAFQLGATLRF